MTPIVCVFNPRSREGIAQRLWPTVERLLGEFGLRAVAVALAPGWEAQLLAALRTGAGQAPAVLGVGGDGTHMAVLNALARLQAAHPELPLPPYALFPAGTGNDVAKSLGLNPGAAHMKRAIATAAHGQIIPYDLGRYGGQLFADAICVGLDAAILARRDRGMAWLTAHPAWTPLLRGYPMYVLATLATAWAAPRWQATITVDGAPWYRGPLSNLVLNNCRIHAGEMDLTPAARTDDGQFDLLVLPSLPAYLTRYALGHRHLPARLKDTTLKGLLRLPRRQGAQILIELDHPAPVQVDGETFPAVARLEISLLAHAARLRAPSVE